MTYPYLDVRLNCNVRTDHEMTPEELLIGVDRSKNVVIEVRFRDTQEGEDFCLCLEADQANDLIRILTFVTEEAMR